MAEVKRTNDEWAALLAEQQASGQTQAAWCAAHGINYHTMIDRARRLRKQEKGPAPASVTAGKTEWVEIRAAERPKPVASIAQVHIEFGVYRLTADITCPPAALAALCRELARPC